MTLIIFLQNILGYTELSLNRSAKDNDDKLIKYLGEIQKGGERGREMIKQMLTYSRSSPSKTSQESLRPLIKEAVQLIKPALSNGTTVIMELPEDLPEVNVDSVQVVQIILNLCVNARDAMEDYAGSINIKMFLSSIKEEECDSCHAVIVGDYVVVSVKDSGRGIPDKIKAHIFDPFYTTKAVDKGTGMGLSMVHGIMHNFGGHIRVSSTPEEGTLFNLFFPVAISKDTKEPTSETLENAEYNRHAAVGGLTYQTGL